MATLTVGRLTPSAAASLARSSERELTALPPTAVPQALYEYNHTLGPDSLPTSLRTEEDVPSSAQQINLEGATPTPSQSKTQAMYVYEDEHTDAAAIEWNGRDTQGTGVMQQTSMQSAGFPPASASSSGAARRAPPILLDAPSSDPSHTAPRHERVFFDEDGNEIHQAIAPMQAQYGHAGGDGDVSHYYDPTSSSFRPQNGFDPTSHRGSLSTTQQLHEPEHERDLEAGATAAAAAAALTTAAGGAGTQHANDLKGETLKVPHDILLHPHPLHPLPGSTNKDLPPGTTSYTSPSINDSGYGLGPTPSINSAAVFTPIAPGQVTLPKRERPSDRYRKYVAYPYGVNLSFCLTVAYVALFVAEFGVDGWSLVDSAVNPSFGPSYATLDHLGGKIGYKLFGVSHGNTGTEGGPQGYRVITSIFWHAGIIHFIPSIFALLYTGAKLEREYGPIRIFCIFFVSAIYGTIFSSLFVVDLLTVSGSAGVYGLIGARFLDTYLYRHWYQRNWVTYLNLTAMAVVGIVIGFLPLIDNYAHIGSLAMGFLIGGILFTGGWRHPPDVNASGIDLHRMAQMGHTKGYFRWRQWCAVGAFSLWVITLILVFVPVKMAVGRSGVDQGGWCKGCDYFQCLPNPSWACFPRQYYF